MHFDGVWDGWKHYYLSSLALFHRQEQPEGKLSGTEVATFPGCVSEIATSKDTVQDGVPYFHCGTSRSGGPEGLLAVPHFRASSLSRSSSFFASTTK
jgi:hypothetical protein